MKRAVLVSAVCVVVGASLSACSSAKTASDPATAPVLGVASTAPSTASAPSGFPSYPQLTGLTNFVSTATVATLATTQHVHSPSNYLQTVGGVTGMTTVLAHGEVYTAFAGKDVTQVAADAASGEPELYGYAEQVEAFATKSAAAVVKKIGTCQVAGADGDRWELSVGGQSAQYVQSEFVVCTRVQDGALLSLQEGAKLLASGASVSAAITVTSIGGVPAYTPSDATRGQ